MKALSLTIKKLWPDRQTDRQTKNYMPHIYRCGGRKKQMQMFRYIKTSIIPFKIIENIAMMIIYNYCCHPRISPWQSTQFQIQAKLQLKIIRHNKFHY